jgi:hypothetical protein
MQTILLTIAILSLARLALEVLTGCFQILAGLTAGILGLGLWGLSIVLEGLENLWQSAFPKHPNFK